MGGVTLLFCKSRGVWREKIFISLAVIMFHGNIFFLLPSMLMSLTDLLTDDFASVFHQQVKWRLYLLSTHFSAFQRQSLHNVTTALYHTPVVKRTNCSHKAQCVHSVKISLTNALENEFPPGNKWEMLCITLKPSGKWKRFQNSLTIKAKLWKPPMSLKHHTEITVTVKHPAYSHSLVSSSK